MNEKKLVRLFYRILLFTAFYIQSNALVFAQQASITGQVTSSDNNELLIGAGISVKGTSRNVVTDINGNYSIPAKENDVLIFFVYGL